eukprot:3141706-Karenia_brevis.AAC.1
MASRRNLLSMCIGPPTTSPSMFLHCTFGTTGPPSPAHAHCAFGTSRPPGVGLPGLLRPLVYSSPNSVIGLQ